MKYRMNERSGEQKEGKFKRRRNNFLHGMHFRQQCMFLHSVDTPGPAQTWKFRRAVIQVLFTGPCLVQGTGRYERKRSLKRNGSRRIPTENRMRGEATKEASPTSIQPPYITFLYLNRLLFDFRLQHFNIAFPYSSISFSLSYPLPPSLSSCICLCLLILVLTRLSKYSDLIP